MRITHLLSYESELAFSFIKSKKGGIFPVNATITLSILSITIGMMVFVFTLSMYDGYVKKLETIIFAIFPQITLQMDFSRHEESAPPVSLFEDEDEEARIGQQVCESKDMVILKDKPIESPSTARRDKGFNIADMATMSQKLRGVTNMAHIRPVIFEEAQFGYQIEQPIQPAQEGIFRILGVQEAERGAFVPEIDRIITNSEILKPLFEPNTNRVLLSTVLYRKLFQAEPPMNQAIHHAIKIVFPTGEPDETMTIEVIGVFKLGVHQIADNLIVTSLETAQRLVQQQNYATFLGISLHDPYRAKETAEEIKKTFTTESVFVFHWLSVASDLFQNLSFYKQMIFIILFMSILITAFTIYNTLTIMIIERKRQIGILMSNGIKRASIYRIFLIISQFVAWSGAAMGILLGVIGGRRIGTALNQILEEFLPVQDAQIYVHVGTIILFLFGVCLTCFVAAFLSARKAVNLDPVECLQWE